MANPPYIRLNVSASVGGASLSVTELTLLSVAGGVQTAIDGTTGTASSSPAANGSHTANCAFDNSTFTGQYWGVAAGSGQLTFHYTTGTVPKVVRYGITPNGWVNDDPPKAWTLETSPDGSTWTVVDTQVNQTGWVEGVTKWYDVPIPVSTTVAGYSAVPSEAWIQAASKTNREPVLLLSVESVNAVNRSFADWPNANGIANVNVGTTSAPRRTVILNTDTGDEYAGEHTAPVDTSTTTHINTHAIRADIMVVTDELVFVSNGVWNLDSYDVRVELWGYRVGGGLEKLAGEKACFDGGTTGRVFIIDSVDYGAIAEGQFTGLHPVIVDKILIRSQELGGYYSPVSVSAAFVSHTDTYQSYYLPSGSLQTDPLDLGGIPSVDTTVNLDASIIAGATLTVTARGSNDATAWTALGQVEDGGLLPPYRYYDFTAAFTSTTGAVTVELASIGISGGDDSYLFFSTHEDEPVWGAKPYLEMKLGTMTSKVELMRLGSIGEVNPSLFYLKDTFKMIRDGYLRNKAITLKYGFRGLPVTDYFCIFGGLWYDYQLDLNRHRLSVTSRTILSRFQKVQLPKELASGAKRTDSNTPVKEWINENIISVMLNIIDELGIQDRYIEQRSFLDLIEGPRSGDDWKVSRRLDKDSKEDALKLLEELSVLSGVFILQLPNGRLRASLYDASTPVTKEITADICTIGPISGGQADLYTRQQICYEPKHKDDLDTGAARGAWTVDVDMARGDTVTVSGVTWYCLTPHKSALENAPGTGAIYRAFWCKEWASGVLYFAGEACLQGGPLYTCTVTHTSSSDTKPNAGESWRTKWRTGATVGGSSASDYYNAYTYINKQAEVDWGVNKDVPVGDPDYVSESGPGYQKNVFDKWGLSANARAALALRMDAWFATPKMRLKVSDLPPTYIADSNREFLLGKMVGLTGFMLPVAGAEWGDVTDNKKYFVLGETLDTARCTVSLDLLEV